MSAIHSPELRLADSSTLTAKPAKPPQSLVLIDPAVSHYSMLVAGVIAEAAVFVLDPDQDGVQQITQILQRHSTVTRLHLIAHGASGCLRLGSTDLDLAHLPVYAKQLQQWCQWLSAEAEILLYGCAVAAGEAGGQFVQQIARLTSAAVAASTTKIGSRDLGGDWHLDVTTGRIKSGLAIRADVLAAYPAVLPIQPDSYGYTAQATSLQSINLVEGAAGVTTLLKGADGSTGIELGSNQFNFYGTTYTGSNQIYATTEGYLALFASGSGSITSTNTDLSVSPTYATIAPLWDDWATYGLYGAQGAVHYQFQDLNSDGVNDRLIVEWENIRPSSDWAKTTVDLATFQAILEINTGSRPGNIIFNYLDVAVANSSFDNGASATVGIRSNQTVNSRLLISYNDGTSDLIGSGKAILIQPPLPTVSLTVPDTTATETTPATDSGTYRITRSNPTGALTVKLAIDASSTVSASDYTFGTSAGTVSVSGSTIIVVMPAGTATVDLLLTPIDDSLNETAETLKLNLNPDSTYSLAAATTGTVTIAASDPNTAPVAANDSYTLTANTSFSTTAVIQSLVMNSEPGNWVGQGANYSYTAANASFSGVRAYPSNPSSNNAIRMTVDPPAAGEWWDLSFAAPANALLTAGTTYTNATRFPFQAANAPGLDVGGSGRGNNSLTGQFTVNQIVYGAGTEILALDASFEQKGEGDTGFLRGRIQYNTTPDGRPSGILTNDTDADRNSLSAVLVNSTANGTLLLNADGSFIYTPNAGFVGTDRFTYRASDGLSNSSLAAVTLNVLSAPSPPSSGSGHPTSEPGSPTNSPVSNPVTPINTPEVAPGANSVPTPPSLTEAPLGSPLPSINFQQGKPGVQIKGDNRSNRLVGSNRRDILNGLGQRDRLMGKAGNDRLNGGDGNDQIMGDGGNDQLNGGKHNDRLIGGNGNDILIGDAGIDMLQGGSGADTFRVDRFTEGSDRVLDFQTNDLIDLRILLAQSQSSSSPYTRFKQFVRLEQVGADTRISIDADGSGTVFVPILMLQNTALSTLSTQHFLV